MQLAGGKLADGTRLFSEATRRGSSRARHADADRRSAAGAGADAANFHGYALGFDIRDYRGQKLVTHTGGLPGYVSRVAMLPETTRRRGAHEPGVGRGLRLDRLHVLDSLPRAPADRLDRGVSEAARARRRTASAESGAAAIARRSSKPSLPLAKLRRHLRDAWYGDVAITEKGGKLTMRFTQSPALVGDLEHWQHDTFVARWRDRELRADAYVTFALNPDGSIDQAKMRRSRPQPISASTSRICCSNRWAANI